MVSVVSAVSATTQFEDATETLHDNEDYRCQKPYHFYQRSRDMRYSPCELGEDSLLECHDYLGLDEYVISPPSYTWYYGGHPKANCRSYMLRGCSSSEYPLAILDHYSVWPGIIYDLLHRRPSPIQRMLLSLFLHLAIEHQVSYITNFQSQP